MPPTGNVPQGVLAATAMPNLGVQAGAIDDLSASRDYSATERRLRCQLASLYRLVDQLKWSQSIYNHMTVRLPSSEEEILINPFGRFYNEVTASSLVKVDLEGKVLDAGTSGYGINQAGYVLHSAIHAARPDVCALIHLHTPSVAAVSAMKSGFLPLCQEAMVIGPVAYHEYQGILVDTAERESIVADLGNKNIMILKNHGFVVCGRTIEEAFTMTYHLILACETQVKAMVCGLDSVNYPSPESIQKAHATASKGGGGVNREENGEVNHNRWGVGELEWEAWMRQLDRLKLSGITRSSISPGVLASTAMPNLRLALPSPIDDLSSDCGFDKAERNLRCQLASLYRLVDLLNWSQCIFNHMTVKLPNTKDEILINPYGMLYGEVTASNLIKVDLDGKILHPGASGYNINQSGYVLHSAIHAARPDVCALIHLHTPTVAAASAMKSGLLPISQEAISLGPIAYYEYQGILVDPNEKTSLVGDLGDKNIMILHNHGFVVCGKTVAKAFTTTCKLLMACEIQAKAMVAGGENLVVPCSKVISNIYQKDKKQDGGSGESQNGKLEWEGWMRQLDRVGMNTGHNYRRNN